MTKGMSALNISAWFRFGRKDGILPILVSEKEKKATESGLYLHGIAEVESLKRERSRRERRSSVFR